MERLRHWKDKKDAVPKLSSKLKTENRTIALCSCSVHETAPTLGALILHCVIVSIHKAIAIKHLD
jgi:hypothetical protein